MLLTIAVNGQITLLYVSINRVLYSLVVPRIELSKIRNLIIVDDSANQKYNEKQRHKDDH